MKGFVRFFILLIILQSLSLIRGQSQNIQQEKNYMLADTVKAKILFEEAKLLLSKSKYDTTLEKIDSALVIYQANQLSNHETALYLSFLKAFCSYKLGDFEGSIQLGEEVLSKRKELFSKNRSDISKSHNNLGIVYRKAKEFDKALYHAKETLKIRLDIYGEDHTQVAKCYGNLSGVYMDMRNFDLAIEYQNKSISLYKKLLGEDNQLVMDKYASLGLIYYRKGEYQKGINIYLEVQHYYEKQFGFTHKGLEWVYNNLGAFHEQLGSYSESIKYHQLALKLRSHLYGKNHYLVGISLNSLGLSYIGNGEIKKAYTSLNNSLTILTEALGEDHFYLDKVYNDLGNYFQTQGDFKKSQEYYFKSLYKRLDKYGENHDEVATIYYNLALIHIALNEFDQAIQYSNKALEIRNQIFGKVSTEIIESHLTLGYAYSKSNQYQKAIAQNQKALHILNEINPINYFLLASIYNNLGTIHLQIGNLQKAIDYLSKSRELKEKKIKGSKSNLAQTYFNLGDCYLELQNFVKADSLYLAAFDMLNYNPNDKNNFKETIPVLVETLRHYSHFNRQWYLNQNKLQKLYKARANIKDALFFLELQLKNINEQSKKDILPLIKTTYLTALSTSLLLYKTTDSLKYLEESFSFAEQSKSSLLYHALQETKVFHFAGIPDSLLQNEHKLRVAITHYEKKRQEKLSAGFLQKDTEILEISEKLFDLNRRFEQLKYNFEQNYQKYYNAKYGYSTLQSNIIQEKLIQPNQSTIEYMIGDSIIYLFVLQKENFEIIEIKKDFPLEKWINDLTKEGIYGYYTTPKSQRSQVLETNTITAYTKAAQQLYEKLIAPIKGKLTKKVTIIPDGILGYIPFEALLTKQPPRVGAFSAYPFLIKEHQISYCYSATLLKEMQEKQHQQNPQKSLLAIAPFYMENIPQLKARIDTSDFSLETQTRDSLGKLVASGIEVASITKIWNGEALYNEAATIEAFHKMAADYQIIHLSTHGKADDRVGDYAYLAFNASKGEAYTKLYARDLYNLSFNTDMVMLSACETGIGKLQKGEGIISLARAFAYAGAKSIFTTLWKVDDEKTKDLVIEFYKNLKQGKAKDEALHLAKLDFLQKHKGKGMATHPFFWSGMIGIGDMRSLE